MGKVIVAVLAVIIVAFAALLAVAATKPDTFRVQRDVTINAPPDKVFPYIDDFHKWTAWSPWEKVDPEMKRSYSGSESDKGAIYQWNGNNEVGEGRMEITDASAPSKIVIKLDFLKPFEAHNTAEFTLAPAGDATKVTWAMYGPCGFPMKVMHCFMDMDKLVGKDFEDGLAKMKTVAEKS